MTCTAASHQGAIEMFWLLSWGAVTLSFRIVCGNDVLKTYLVGLLVVCLMTWQQISSLSSSFSFPNWTEQGKYSLNPIRVEQRDGLSERALTSKMWPRQSDWLLFFFIGMSSMNCIRSGETDKREDDEGTVCMSVISMYQCGYGGLLTHEALDR